MKNGKQLAETVLADEGFMSGLPEPRQREIVAAYVEANLPGVLNGMLAEPATFSNALKATATCLKDMNEKGVILDIIRARPQCAACTCCSDAPQIDEWMRANIAAIEGAADKAAGCERKLVEVAPGCWTDHFTALVTFGLTPENAFHADEGNLTIGQLLESQPALFLHPHAH